MTDKQADFISHLFDAISGDPAMPAELKVSLLRLQIPIHKLSQTDVHFISNEKHPARRILFIIKRMSQAAHKDASLITRIDLILSALVKSTPSATNFARANQHLHQLLRQCLEADAANAMPEQKTEQKKTGQHSQQQPQPASHTDVALNELKQQFNRKIKMCIQGHQVPTCSQHLVLKLWPNALFYIFKTHGDQSPHWVNAITLFCELLTSIQPITSIEQYRHLKDTFMVIARKNNNTLLQYHQNSVVETDIKALISLYNQMLGSTQYARESEGGDSPMSILDKISSLPAEIKPGIWCEIYIDEITPARRLRLSLINIDTGTLIFVNRKGIRKIEKDAYAFSEELKRGLSRVYKHDALFNKPSSGSEFQKIG